MTTKGRTDNQQGYVLVTALMILVLLLACAAVVYFVSTKDLRIAGRIAGEKKAFAAVEAGLNQLNLVSNLSQGDIVLYTVGNTVVDVNGDPDSRYRITAYSGPAMAIPANRDMPEYSINGRDYKQLVSAKTIIGENTRYQTQMTVDVAVGYGPVEVSPGY